MAKNEPEAGTHATVEPGQLSDTTGAAKVTAAPHWFGAFPTVTFAGQVTVGFCVSLTVTVNEHEPVLPDASVAVHVTEVVPCGKNEPDGGEHVTVEPGQLSDAVGVV